MRGVETGLGERPGADARRVVTGENSALPLTEAVARYFFKLMSYKDEYEVARLYTRPEFTARLQEQFEGDIRLQFHLAPPLLAKRKPDGQLIKRTFGPWVMPVFGVLARLRGLRGSALDVFGYTEERRSERALIAEYEATISGLLADLTAQRRDLAVSIASVPEHIRGFGHVKARHLAAAVAQRAQLLEQYRSPVASGERELKREGAVAG